MSEVLFITFYVSKELCSVFDFCIDIGEAEADAVKQTITGEPVDLLN